MGSCICSYSAKSSASVFADKTIVTSLFVPNIVSQPAAALMMSSTKDNSPY